MLGALYALARGAHLAVFPFRVLEPTAGPEHASESFAGVHGLGVLGALYALARGVHLAVLPFRVLQLAAVPEHASEVFAGAQGVAVVGGLHALARGVHLAVFPFRVLQLAAVLEHASEVFAGVQGVAVVGALYALARGVHLAVFPFRVLQMAASLEGSRQPCMVLNGIWMIWAALRYRFSGFEHGSELALGLYQSVLIVQPSRKAGPRSESAGMVVTKEALLRLINCLIYSLCLRGISVLICQGDSQRLVTLEHLEHGPGGIGLPITLQQGETFWAAPADSGQLAQRVSRVRMLVSEHELTFGANRPKLPLGFLKLANIRETAISQNAREPLTGLEDCRCVVTWQPAKDVEDCLKDSFRLLSQPGGEKKQAAC